MAKTTRGNKFSIILNILLILFLIGYFLFPFLDSGFLTKIYTPLCHISRAFQTSEYLAPWCQDVFEREPATEPITINANNNINKPIININEPLEETEGDEITEIDQDLIVVAPNIKVTFPQENEQLSSPFTVEGEARVFENQVFVRVKNPKGDILILENTIANSSDIGQWGNFSIEINYEFDLTKEGVVEVYSKSAKDGSEENLISITVKF